MKVLGRPGDFACQVVAWQKHQGRNHLPWQNTRDPYRVWLSEIMLQQTQVVTVMGYFERFVQRFPDVAALAKASQDEVLGLWSGLGYYSRARNLHRCAQQVMALHGGAFPQDAQTLATLPGIGRSTAAAISSLCFGECVPILDANVKRVVTRVCAFGEDLARAKHEKTLWQLATDLLPHGPGAKESMPRYTQGMMDLGATVCSPKAPDCQACPVNDRCEARRSGNPEHYPVRSRKLKRSAQSLWLLWALSESGAVLLSKRPTPGVWAGLYCLPLFESETELLQALPPEWRAQTTKNSKTQVQHLAPMKHVLTHKDLFLHPVRVRLMEAGATLPEEMPAWADGDWFGADQWPALGLPAPIRKLLETA